MEFILPLLFLLSIRTCQLSPSNDNAAAGEIWSNQTDIEVVNGTNIQNMLQKCEGCIINIKTIPSDDATQNEDNTAQKDVVNSDQVTSKTKDSPSLNEEKDITMDHASELSNMVKQCPGCYVDYQSATQMHTNKVTPKINKDKKKGKDKKKKKKKKEEKKLKESLQDEKINLNSVQPPEIQIPHDSKDASEMYTLNDLSPSGNVTGISSEMSMMTNDGLFSNTNNTQSNPTDEQLGSTKQSNHNYVQPAEVNSQNISDAKAEAFNTKEDSVASSQPAEEVSPQNVTGSDTRTPSGTENMSEPITIDVENHQKDEGLFDYITPKELKKILNKEDVRLIDLRETWEINNSGKVKNSVHIALNSLGLALKLTENKFKNKYGINKPETDDCNLIFMDSSGERSKIAYKYAKEHGFQCPRLLVGGFDSWRSLLGEKENLLYDDMPKVNLTKVDVNNNANSSNSQYEMKMKKTLIRH